MLLALSLLVWGYVAFLDFPLVESDVDFNHSVFDFLIWDLFAVGFLRLEQL